MEAGRGWKGLTGLSGLMGLAGRLIRWWRSSTLAGAGRGGRARRLALIERIALGPRQTLALVEADGIRLLVTVSPEGAPAVFPLAQADSFERGALARPRPAPARSGMRRSGRAGAAGRVCRPEGARW